MYFMCGQSVAGALIASLVVMFPAHGTKLKTLRKIQTVVLF
jgi:hypothetical protein